MGLIIWSIPGEEALLLAQESNEKPDRVWRVSIDGNKRFEDIVLKRYIANKQPSAWKKLTFFRQKGFEVSETEVRRDAIRIQRFYQRRGFNDVEVEYRIETLNRSWKKHLIFSVTENLPIRTDSIEIQLVSSKKDSVLISEDGSFARAVRRLPYRKGRIYEPIREPAVIASIEQGLRELGFPYSETRVQAYIDTTAKAADLVVATQTGPRARIDTIHVEGETTLAEEYIIRESGLESGNFFSERSLREAQREVFKHHLFRLALVSIPEQPMDTTINLLLRVKELPLRSLQFRFGAGDFDRLDERLALDNFYKLFRTQASWTYRNVRGKGEKFTISGRYSHYNRRISGEYVFPYIYNTKSSVIINPFYQFRDERSYDILSAGIINTFGYEYSRNLTGTFSYEYAINDESNVRSASEFTELEVQTDSLLSYNISSITGSLFYTNHVRRDREGVVVQPFLELSGVFGESTFSFQKTSIDVRKYTELNPTLVLAARARGGAIYYAKQDSLPSDIRFYAGGTNSVRGWGTQQLGPKRVVSTTDTSQTSPVTGLSYVPEGGRAVFNFNVELRQDLNGILKGFGMAAFLDGGQVWSELGDIDFSGLQFGVGGGLRYQSPIGPIRIDVGYKINPSRADLNRFDGGIDEGNWTDRWAIHFSIGQAF
ncbi:MAG: hypothetical protein ED557_08625 [Balneola sp.]|nr:MAG: hypothetical protein ED557_08625 [Balneola sp.]